jgi:hypothetical protein
MAYIPLNFPPGVFRNGTAYQAKGRWYDANLVRWRNRQLQPIGGWQRVSTSPFSGKARGLIAWRTNDQDRWLAVGTSTGLFVFDRNNLFIDVTPGTEEDPFLVGRDTSVYGLGFGVGKYGEDAYGTERPPSGLVLEAAYWSLDTWGENLIACAPHDGRIYEWIAGPEGSPQPQAEIIANAPIDCRGAIVTEERHLVALGANGDPRKIAWSSQEDNTAWTPSATNTAGDLQLVTAGFVLSARRMPGQTLIWTDQDVHAMRYVGPPLVYGIERVGTSCGLAGPNAHMSFGNAVVWMSEKGFFVYDGVVRPLESEVNDYVFNDINFFQNAKITAGHLANEGEIWWFYPSKNSVENNRYVIWNYRENHWSIGQLPRTAWIDSGVYPFPIAAGADNHIYQHEQGWTNNGASRVGQVYAKSAPIEIGSGDQVMFVKQLIPDGCPNVPTCTRVSFEVKQTPTGPATIFGPYNFNRPDGYADARFNARQVAITVEGVVDSGFTFGTLRLDAAPGGNR